MKWLRYRGIAFKLSLMVLGGVSLIFAVILTLNHNSTCRLMTEKIEANAFNMTQATAYRINALLKAAEKIPAGIANTITKLNPSDEELKSLLKSRLAQNPELFGIAVAFAAQPKTVSKKSTPNFTTPDGFNLYSRYYIRASNNQIKYSPINYDYRYHDWYQIPKVLNKALWSEPYFGESGQIIMTSYSFPFYRDISGKHKFAGIVCVDLSLNWLRNVISSLKIGKTGYAFLITRNGTFVTHPKLNLIMNETIFSVAESRNDTNIREIGRSMIAGEKGFTAFTSLTDNKAFWMVHTPLNANGWSIGVLFPQQELMADIQQLTSQMTGLGVAGFFLIMLVILTISGRITKPLRALAVSANKIASGNLETKIPLPKNYDEVGRLTRSFAEMQNSLKDYIKNLTETTAAKERIESELNIASEIQMGILPKIFPPPFPNRPEFNLYATIKPAREVGGDLYDFFMIDDQHLGFTVGDVSGKGVAAALFMAITQTLIKTQVKAQSQRSSAQTLEQVNNDLAKDNPSMMFVTLFLGILNIETGELEYCNGGHNPPYLLLPENPQTKLQRKIQDKTQSENQGESLEHSDFANRIQELPTTEGIALGVMDDFTFTSNCITLTPNTTLFLFTDGVTEAMNSRKELFSEARLEKILAPMSEQPTRKIADKVMHEIESFSAGEPQTDDITMLVLRYTG